jgi:hypothetical protein
LKRWRSAEESQKRREADREDAPENPLGRHA